MSDIYLDNCKPATSTISISLNDPVRIRCFDGANKPITYPQLFKTIVENHGNRPALVSKDGQNNWITQTYQEYWDNSRKIAKAFIKLGLEARTSCGILAFNSPEWFIAHMAAIFSGGVSAGIYLTNSAEAVYHVLDTSSATVCIVEDSVQMAKVRAVKNRLPKLKAVIQIQAPYEDFINVEEGFYSWSHIEAIGENDESLELELEERLKNVAANECVTLIYTSGTVGMPKGVMLSHDSIMTISTTMIKAMPNVVVGEEVVVSYLPLNHVGGQVLDIFMGLMQGACVYFADRDALKGTLVKTLRRAQPTSFFAVPRIYEKMHEKLLAAEHELSWISRFILNTARSVVENYHLSMIESGSKPTSMSTWSYWLASKITRKARIALGFGECKTYWVGAAPTSLETKKFFLGYDIKLWEMYGLSEASGAISTTWDLESLESCGKALPGTELKLANTDENGHGEICCRSRMVFMGYLHEPEKTREALTDDGWLHTGDIGYLDSKGHLYVTGRLKELIVTSGGENIPPSHIEQLVLNELPGLSNAMLIGDRKKYLTMLVTIKTGIDSESGRPNDDLLPESLEWMQELELPYVKLSEILNAGPCPKVVQSIQQGIDRANANAISRAQKVQKFAILPHDFSIATGELGPTLKLRRNVVLQKYAEVIERFYTGS